MTNIVNFIKDGTFDQSIERDAKPSALPYYDIDFASSMNVNFSEHWKCISGGLKVILKFYWEDTAYNTRLLKAPENATSALNLNGEAGGGTARQQVTLSQGKYSLTFDSIRNPYSTCATASGDIEVIFSAVDGSVDKQTAKFTDNAYTAVGEWTKRTASFTVDTDGDFYLDIAGVREGLAPNCGSFVTNVQLVATS